MQGAQLVAGCLWLATPAEALDSLVFTLSSPLPLIFSRSGGGEWHGAAAGAAGAGTVWRAAAAGCNCCAGKLPLLPLPPLLPPLLLVLLLLECLCNVLCRCVSTHAAVLL